MNKLFLGSVLATTALATGWLATPASAATLNDTTQVQTWKSGAPVAPPVWSDVIPTSGGIFETSRIVANYNTNNGRTNFDVYTNFPLAGTSVSGTTVRMADFFFDLDGTGVGGTAWDHALRLTTSFGAVTGAAFVQLTGLQTSDDLFKNTFPAVDYGGAYRPNGNLGAGTSPIPVVAIGTLDAITVVGNVATGGINQTNEAHNFNNQSTTTKVEFSLLGLAPSSFNILWGTATCANDVITGELNTVPLPAALPMFLGALAGLGLIGRRKAN